jgi:hypothetical protein
MIGNSWYGGFSNIKISMIGKVVGSPYNIFLLRLLDGMSGAVACPHQSAGQSACLRWPDGRAGHD